MHDASCSVHPVIRSTFRRTYVRAVRQKYTFTCSWHCMVPKFMQCDHGIPPPHTPYNILQIYANLMNLPVGNLGLGKWVIRWVNWLTQINPYNHIVHVKSTLQLISFGFSDRSVRSLVSANPSASCWAILKSRRKNDFHFWLIFGFSLNLGRGESLNERLIQKVKWPNVNAKNRCILV